MPHGDCHATSASCVRVRYFRAVVARSPFGSIRFRRCKSACRPRTWAMKARSRRSSAPLRMKILERIVMFGLAINVISESELSVFAPGSVSRSHCCAGGSELQNQILADVVSQLQLFQIEAKRIDAKRQDSLGTCAVSV